MFIKGYSRSQHKPFLCRSRACLGCRKARWSFYCFFLLFCLYGWLSFVIFVFLFWLFPQYLSPSFTHSLAHSQLSTITPSLIILLLFFVFYWSSSLPNSLSPFQIPSHMVHQSNPLPRYLIIKSCLAAKRLKTPPATIEPIPLLSTL